MTKSTCYQRAAAVRCLPRAPYICMVLGDTECVSFFRAKLAAKFATGKKIDVLSKFVLFLRCRKQQQK